MRLTGRINQLSGPRGIRRAALFGSVLLLTSCALFTVIKRRAINLQTPSPPPAFNESRESTFPRQEREGNPEPISAASRENLAAALARAEKKPDRIARNMAMASAFAMWSQKDIEGALSWLENKPAPKPEFNTDECLIEALMKINPIIALDRLDRSENPDVSDSLKNKFVLRLAESNPRSAVLELLIVGREKWTIRAAVADTIIDQWFRQSPEEAAKLVALLPPGVEQDQAKLSATDAWSGLSPNKTAAWVESFPDGPIKDDALQRVTKAWLAQDLSAPMKWIQGMQAGRSRDVAIATLCVQLGEIYPSELSGWARQINDETLRKQALATIKTTN
ncbi:MAG TPA: hypothetical protein VK985_05335 [Rariglobus sp.]|nr:hypothetical protein [Rariglobus sp.]